MFKKLDLLILKAFLGPFIVTFFVAVFVLMMQIVWKYVDDLVGKGLDFITIGKFVWYAGASLLTLAMPIAILISSIMTFGNLGESFELVAIKSSGISLIRFMRPLMFVSILLCGITFLFANYIIPFSQLKFVTLYNDIYYKKPAFDLKEGVFFTQIPGYVIKTDKKDKDGKTINNILIYEQSGSLQDNAIIAKSGEMKISEDKNFLEFNLKDGYRYQENGSYNDSTTEFIRLKFKNYKKLFDLSILKMSKTSDSVFKNNAKMYSSRQILLNINTANKELDSVKLSNSKALKSFVHYNNISDGAWQKALSAKTPIKKIPDSLNRSVIDLAITMVGSIKSGIGIYAEDQKNKISDLKYLKIELHRKFSLSLACLVLFFIGAPLGSIIRKGGLGMPLVVAIVFFLIFHLLNMFGEKFAKDQFLSEFTGMWLAIICLTPVGIFFTIKAMNDSQLFNREWYTRILNNIKSKFSFKK